MNNTSESLLNAWLRLSTSVINPRLVSEISYNESLVCNILYNNYCNSPEKKTDRYGPLPRNQDAEIPDEPHSEPSGKETNDCEGTFPGR